MAKKQIFSLLLALLAVHAVPQVPSAAAYKGDCAIFVLKDCPIANQYAPELKRLIHAYTAKGIQFMMVFEDADLTSKQMAAHAMEYGFSIPMQQDANHRIAKQLGVDVSPTVVLAKR